MFCFGLPGETREPCSDNVAHAKSPLKKQDEQYHYSDYEKNQRNEFCDEERNSSLSDVGCDLNHSWCSTIIPDNHYTISRDKDQTEKSYRDRG